MALWYNTSVVPTKHFSLQWTNETLEALIVHREVVMRLQSLPLPLSSHYHRPIYTTIVAWPNGRFVNALRNYLSQFDIFRGRGLVTWLGVFVDILLYIELWNGYGHASSALTNAVHSLCIIGQMCNVEWPTSVFPQNPFIFVYLISFAS